MPPDAHRRPDPGRIRNIVLVHGAFVDGSGWEGVYRLLSAKGYEVTVVQHPTASLAEDVAYVARAIAAQDGPVALVGHSYGGAIITEAGRDPKVKALVYIAGWVPDSGQSVLDLIGQLPAGAPSAPVLPPSDGFLFVDPVRFPAAFAADVDPAKAQFMAIAQAPWGVAAASATVGEPAWKTKPSWYLVASEDRMIPPEAQRTMAARAGANVTEAAGSHAIFVAKPESTAALIEAAAEGALAAVA
ncbi:MAG TPA: alpha/beta hydrolase [Allosphingosinicella sp.]|jgi:pimeloyl-ACP methyl ester carboxylesterase